MSLFIEFLNNLKHVGLEWYKRYYSVYPGIVVDNNDPDQRGRIKFRCPSVFGKEYVFPSWAEPHHLNLAASSSGELLVPYVDQWVSIMFEYGDVKNPIYHGGFFAAKELPADFKNGYPDVRGWVFKSGTKILVGEAAGNEFLHLIHKSGSFVKINPDGTISASGKDISLQSIGKTSVDAGGEVTVNAGGDVKVKAGGNAVIDAAQIQLNGSMGKVLTTMSDPVVDNITGQPSQGVATVFAGK